MNEVNAEEEWAVRLDRWIAWQAEERVEAGRHFLLFSLFLRFCSEESYPEFCAQCTDEAEDLFSCVRKRPLCLSLPHVRHDFHVVRIPLGVKDVKQGTNK